MKPISVFSLYIFSLYIFLTFIVYYCDAEDFLEDLLPSGLNCSVVTGNLTYYNNKNLTKAANWNCSALPVAQSCPAGLYSSPGSATCSLQCPARYYCPGNGSSILCPSGTFSLGGADSPTCTPCPANYYCTNGVKIVCPSAMLSNVASGSCTLPCPAGFYCPGVGYAIECSVPGTYSLPGAVNCTTCEAGYYCPTPSSHLFCPPNTWSLPGSTTSCTLPCPTGVVCPGNGKMSCTVCTPGIFTVRACSADGDTICNATCPPGMFGAFYTKGFCKECEQGYYNDKYGVSSCTSCLPTTFANTTGNTACQSCPSGYNTNKFTGYIECRKVSPFIYVHNKQSIYLCLNRFASRVLNSIYNSPVIKSHDSHEAHFKRFLFCIIHFLSFFFLPIAHLSELHVLGWILLSK
jgi:hypothetical protein